mmetsp:Transcript_12221/g.18347  ORF Transcript_12221/g.18347 Transcript_12221/m.18347 type:complete len:84 (-) Transcript_12221:1447-1698(-)
MSVFDTIYSRTYARFSVCFVELKIANHIVDLYICTINQTGLLQSSSCNRIFSRLTTSFPGKRDESIVAFFYLHYYPLEQQMNK